MRNRVIALVKYDRRGASSRVRFWNLVPELRDRGWDVVVWPLLTDNILSGFYARGRHSYFDLSRYVLKRIKDILSIGSPQIVWVEKEILHGLPALFEKALFGSKFTNTIIDYDDAVFLNYTDAWLGQLGRRKKFQNYAREAAFITVGSESLQNQMSMWGCARAKRIPSTVVVSSYPIHQHQNSGAIIIGWIGTPKTVRFLEALRNVFPVIASKFQIQLRIVGAEWECAGVDVLTIPWSEKTESEIVGGFDIGVMPLIDGPWERAKCGYKLIQYMAAGVVPMGARVGENKIIIQDGVNGYLASQPEEWIEKLLLLCGNAQLRSVVGARARQTALEKYDVRIAAEAVHEVFSEVVRRQTKGAQ